MRHGKYYRCVENLMGEPVSGLRLNNTILGVRFQGS